MAGYTSAEVPYPDVFIRRFHADGTPDTSFGDGGAVFLDPATFHSPPVDLASGPNRTYLAGVNEVASLRPDGSLDPDFGEGGVVWGFTHLNEIAVDSAGRIVIGGFTDSGGPHFSRQGWIDRLKSDGTRDASFGSDPAGVSIPSEGVRSLLVLPDDGVLAAGSVRGLWSCVYEYGNEPCVPERNGTLTGLSESGQPVPDFGGDGTQELWLDGLDELTDLALDDQGRVLASGWTQEACCAQPVRSLVTRHLASEGLADFDADGIEDSLDSCPARFSSSSDGCPTHARVLTVESQVTDRGRVLISGSIETEGDSCYLSGDLRLERKRHGEWRTVREIENDRFDFHVFDLRLKRARSARYRVIYDGNFIDGYGTCLGDRVRLSVP